MNVLVWGREGTQAHARADGFTIAPSQDALFAHADVLSLHVKLTAETRGIVTAADLARMKPSALLVNTSRATLIAPGALDGGAAGRSAGLLPPWMSSRQEPVLGAAHPLLALDNVVATPHLGYVEKDSYEEYFGAGVRPGRGVCVGRADRRDQSGDVASGAALPNAWLTLLASSCSEKGLCRKWTPLSSTPRCATISAG